jgi:hypothetical protein
MEYKIKIIITKKNIMWYEKIFDDHISAKLAIIKQLFKLNCHGTISNCGEFKLGNYNNDIYNHNVSRIDLTNLPVKDEVPYSHGCFRYYRVVPDLLNNLDLMCEEIIQNNGDIKVYLFIIDMKHITNE